MTMSTFNELDLIRRARIARLATASANGRPSVNPLFFVLRGRELWLGTPTWTLAARNVASNPAVSVLIDSHHHGVATTMRITGRAAVKVDPSTLHRYNASVALKYVVRPGYVLDSLRHPRQVPLKRHYHRQSTSRGPASVIVVDDLVVEVISAT